MTDDELQSNILRGLEQLIAIKKCRKKEVAQLLGLSASQLSCILSSKRSFDIYTGGKYLEAGYDLNHLILAGEVRRLHLSPKADNLEEALDMNVICGFFDFVFFHLSSEQKNYLLEYIILDK